MRGKSDYRKGGHLLNLLWILLYLAVTCSGTEAAGEQGQAASIESQTVVNWSPELTGDQWEWRLTKYRYYENAYKIDGRTFLMLSSNADPTDNVLWDPLTGRGLHLDTREYVQFRKGHADDWNSPLHPFPMYGDRHLGAETSPGVPMCNSIFDHFFVLSDSSGHRIIRTFYVARRIDHPEVKRYPVCFDGPSAETRSIKVEFEEIGCCLNLVPLPDGSIIFLSLFEKGLLIVRLDKDGRQYTSPGSSILTLDAATINAELRATPSNYSDPSIRYNIFQGAIRASQRSETP
jgi:hypothetical protein